MRTFSDPSVLAFLDGDGPPPGGLDGAALDELVAELVDRKDIDRLLRLAAAGGKAVEKAAKKGLHRLRTRGVAVPEVKAPDAGRLPLPAARTEAVPSLFSAIDGGGDRMMWLCFERDGNVQVLEARCNDRLGLQGCSAGAFSRKRHREWSRGLLEDDSFTIARVDTGRLRALLEEAAQLTAAQKRAVPADYNRMRAQLPPATPSATHPALERWPEAPAASPDEILGLHGRPACRMWIPDRETFDRTALKLAEVEQSRLMVDERQRAEQARATLAKACDEYFDAPTRARFRRRLLDTTELLLCAADEEGARLARAAADLFAEDGPPASTMPFALRIFEKVFPNLGQAAPEEAAPSGLIL